MKSEESEISFEKIVADEHAIASRRIYVDALLGKQDEILLHLEEWKQEQLAAMPGHKRDSLHFNRVEFKGMPCLQYDGSFECSPESANKFSRYNFKGYLFPVKEKPGTVVQLEVSTRSNSKGLSEDSNLASNEFFEKAKILGQK